MEKIFDKPVTNWSSRLYIAVPICVCEWGTEGRADSPCGAHLREMCNRPWRRYTFASVCVCVRCICVWVIPCRVRALALYCYWNPAISPANKEVEVIAWCNAITKQCHKSLCDMLQRRKNAGLINFQSILRIINFQMYHIFTIFLNDFLINKF